MNESHKSIADEKVEGKREEFLMEVWLMSLCTSKFWPGMFY